MVTERFQRVKVLFLSISALPKTEWGAALQARCPDELREEVTALLAHHRDESVFAQSGKQPAGGVSRRLRDTLLGRVAPAIAATAMMAAGLALNFELRADSLRRLILFMCLVAIAALAVAVSRRARRAGRSARPDPVERLGPYELTQRLGMGAMGEVYLAWHRVLHRRCAIKLIRPEQAGSEDALLRFEREVRTMAQLTHPNTVEIYDFGRAGDDSFFYAMEYLPGMTLDALLARHGPLSPGRAVYLLLQVCGALAEAHGKGLVHRDLKPSNIRFVEQLVSLVRMLTLSLRTSQQNAAGDLRARAWRGQLRRALAGRCPDGDGLVVRLKIVEDAIAHHASVVYMHLCAHASIRLHARASIRLRTHASRR